MALPRGWWNEFFDEHYLATYATRQDEERSRSEALAAVELAGCESGARLLDAPCGFGRHSIPLAEAGYEVVGADLSTVLLAEARRRAPADGGPEFVQADYRSLPVEPGSFDAVLNLFTSIGYLGDEGDLDVLREFRRVLRPGGRVMIETMHRDRLVRVFQGHGWEALPADAILLEDRTFDPVAGTVESTNSLLRLGELAFSRSFTLRVYTATELVRMLERAGFSEISCYGSLDGEPLTTDSRLVAVGSATA